MKEQKGACATTINAIQRLEFASLTGLKAAESLQGVKSRYEYVEGNLTPATLTVIGFDAEWVLRDDKCSNRVLSYQWAVKTPAGECEGIYYVAKEAGGDGKRLKFHQLLSLAIQDALHKGLLKKWPKTVYATAHWTRADLSHFVISAS